MLLSCFSDDSLCWLSFSNKSVSSLALLTNKVHKEPKLFDCAPCDLEQVFSYWTESLHAKNWISNHLISFFFFLVSFVHLTCSFWRSRQSQPSCSVVFLCFSLIFPASFQPFCHRPLIFKSPNACFCPSTLCVLIFYIHSHERIIVKGVQVN